MISIASFDEFLAAGPVQELTERYDRSLPLFRAATLTIYNDVRNYNEERGYFSSIRSRIKSKNSLFFKIYSDLRENNKEETMASREAVGEAYENIKDIVGLRVACQYLSEIRNLANKVFWGSLLEKGYVDLRQRNNGRFEEKDYTVTAEKKTGYRGFHLYLEVPTEVDIFGNRKEVICEVQIRTEVQHIWAARSHDLVFKPRGEVSSDDEEEMRIIGNQLHAADWFLDKFVKRLTPGVQEQRDG